MFAKKLVLSSTLADVSVTVDLPKSIGSSDEPPPDAAPPASAGASIGAEADAGLDEAEAGSGGADGAG